MTDLASRGTLLAGVLGCVVSIAYMLGEYPSAARDITSAATFRFVAALSVYTMIVLAPPRMLTENRAATRVGVFAGIAMFVVTSTAYWRVNGVQGGYVEGLFFAVLLTAIFAAFGVCAAIIAAMERSFRAGVVTAFWASLMCAPLGFIFDLVITLTVNLEAHSRIMLGGRYASDTSIAVPV